MAVYDVSELQLPLTDSELAFFWPELSGLPWSTITETVVEALLKGNYKGHPCTLLSIKDEEGLKGWLLYASDDFIYLKELLYLYTLPEQRKKGVALALFSHFNQNFRSFLRLFYVCDGGTNCLAVEALISRFGWSKPRLRWLRCRFHAPTFAADWFIKRRALQAPYTLFALASWSQQRLKKACSAIVCPENLLPCDEKNPLEPINSVGVLYKKKLVGWMATRRAKSDTIRYAAYWLNPKHRLFNVALAMLCESIVMQKQSDVLWAVCEISWDQSAASWRRFALRALIPFTCDHEWIGSSGKAPLSTPNPKSSS